MPKTVFISSTYYDLIDYRRRVWETLSELDLRILGMEKFGARSTTPLQTCLEQVDKSDIFVGIIGFRYGSVEKTSKKSYTQLEYERAIEKGIETLIYFYSDNAYIKTSNIEQGINARRLEKFKKTLRRHTTDSFIDPDDLAYKIQVRINELTAPVNTRIRRPKTLECTVTRFKLFEENWVIFVGYLNDKPYEIFAGPNSMEIFPVPASITKGLIIENRDEKGRTRYDFQYRDKYGYKNTLGGLNNPNGQIQNYCSIINKLLKEDYELSKLGEIINDLGLIGNQKSKDWLSGLKKALITK